MTRPEESKHTSWPKPKKIDPYYSNMIDLYRQKVKVLKGLLGTAICPNAMNGCKDGTLVNPYGEEEKCQWCEMTKQALR